MLINRYDYKKLFVENPSQIHTNMHVLEEPGQPTDNWIYLVYHKITFNNI